MGVPEETKSKLEQLKKDQEALKAQLAELDTYLMKKYGTKKSKPSYAPSYTPSYTPPYHEERSYGRPYSRPQPDYSQYTAQELAEMRDLLSQSIQNSRRLTEKFDYLLDALISSLDEMNSEDVDKTIRVIAESQAHMLDNLAETRKALEMLENQAVTKEDLQEFTKEYKERYAELARRINELVSKVEQPAVMDAISALQTQISQVSAELKDLEENVKSGGKTKELIEKTNQLATRIQSLEERLKTITDSIQSMSQHVYASEAALAQVSNLENEIANLKQLVQTLQNTVLQETDMNKVEIEKAVREISQATQGMGEIKELVEIEKEREKRLDKFEKEMEELEAKLEKMNEIDARLAKLEDKVGKVERFVDVYPIGEVQELSALKSELAKIKPDFKTEQFSRIEKRIDDLEKQIHSMIRQQESEKKVEVDRLRDLVARLDKKLNEIEEEVSRNKTEDINRRLKELEEEIKNMREARKELAKIKKPEDVERFKETILDLDRKLSMMQKRIDDLYSEINEKRPDAEIKTDIMKMESILEYLQKSSVSKKEMNETIKSLQEMIDNLEDKLEKANKTWNKPAIREVKNRTKDVEAKIKNVENRMVIENRLSVCKMHKLLLTRVNNLEKLVKMGVLDKRGVKRELTKVASELDNLKREMSRNEYYKDTIKQVARLKALTQKAIKSRHPEKFIPKIKKSLIRMEMHPKQKVDKAVSGLFMIRKEIEERNKADRETMKKIREIMKQIKDVEKSVNHDEIVEELAKTREEIKKLMDKLKKSPRRYLPRLEKIENKLVELRDRIEEADREATLLFKLEDDLEKKEEMLNEINRKIAAGSIDGKEAAKRINEITSEIEDLRRRIAQETMAINNIVKSLSEAKSQAEELIPVAEMKELIDNARKALKKKDIKSARAYLKKARELMGKKKNDEILSAIEDLDKRIKAIGEVKAEKLEKLEKKHKTGLFSRVLSGLHGLVHVHGREVKGREKIPEKKVGEMKKHVSGLMLLIEDMENRKAKPEELEKARKHVEEVEKSIAHVKPTPSIPAKEIEKSLIKAEKEAMALSKELKRVSALAEESNKSTAKKLRGTWVRSLVIGKQVKATEKELEQMKKALEESEKTYKERTKKLRKAKSVVESASVPIEILAMEFIENMKPSEEISVKEMAKLLRVNKEKLLDSLKKIKGNFKLENTGLMAKIMKKEPKVVRL